MKKKIDPLLADMAARDAARGDDRPIVAPAAALDWNSPPVSLDYQPLTSGERWRVEKFEFLALEFGLAEDKKNWPEAMAVFHEIVCAQARWWMFVRRLYGVMPLVP